MTRLSIRPFGKETLTDFYAVHSQPNGAGWCFCAAWWLPDWNAWGERSAEQNRAVREAVAADGRSDGYILYLDGRPAGWCQAGARDAFPKLLRAYDLAPDEQAAAVSCFLIPPALRRQGLAAGLLKLVLADLRSRGFSRVQAFPHCGAELADDDVWTGPEALFTAAGFSLLKADVRRPVYQLEFCT